MCENPSSLNNNASHDCLITINHFSWIKSKLENHDNHKSNVNSKSFINIHREVSENMEEKKYKKSISIKVKFHVQQKFICLATLNSRVSIITFINFDTFCSFDFFLCSVIITVLLPLTKMSLSTAWAAVWGVGKGALEQKHPWEMSPATSKQFSRCIKNISKATK